MPHPEPFGPARPFLNRAWAELHQNQSVQDFEFQQFFTINANPHDLKMV
jgi:hypothetical protein